jgi:hypothetical protein
MGYKAEEHVTITAGPSVEARKEEMIWKVK